MRTGGLLGALILKAGEGANLVTFGAAAAAGDHIESTTAHATKGKWVFGGSEWVEGTNCLGIACTAPTYNLELGAAALMRFQGLANGLLQVDANGVVSVSAGGVPAPAAPSGLVLTGITSSGITLNWTDNSSNETGFKVERSTDNFSTSVQVTTTGPAVTTFTDSGLAASTTYYYRVIAHNDGGDSGYVQAGPVTTTGAAGAPTGPGNSLVLDQITASSIRLTWVDNSNNETGFKIERSRDNFQTNIPIVTTAANATTYTDTTPNASTLYYYRVRATNATGDSTNSNTAQATTLAVGVSDNFSGSGRISATTLGTSSGGQLWTPRSGTWGVDANNHAYVAVDGAGFSFDNVSLAGQAATGTILATIFALADVIGVGWRWVHGGTDASSSGYVCHYKQSLNAYTIGYWSGSTFQQIGSNSSGFAPASGDVIRVIIAPTTPQLTVAISQGGGGFITIYTSNTTDEAGILAHNTSSTLHGLNMQSAGVATGRYSSYSFQ